MDLTENISEAIERIVQDVLKATFRNPRESAFVVRYAVAQKNAAQKRRALEAQGKHVPPFLIASITTQCNLFCKGCYARANQSCSEGLERDELSDGQWEQIFREAAGLGVAFILLAGGEPLMRRGVLQTAAGFPEIVFPVFTNGTMIDESFLDLFDKNRNLVPVLSLEGDGAQTDARRGMGTYASLERAMDEMKRRGIFYGVSVMVTTQNLHSVTDGNFISMMNKCGCRVVLYVEYVPVTTCTDMLAMADPDRQVLEQKKQELIRQYQDLFFLSFPGDEKHMGGCLAAGRGFFHINATGGAEPCPASPFSDRNLKDCSLSEAIQSPLFQQLRDKGFLSEEHTGGCVLFDKQDEIRSLGV